MDEWVSLVANYGFPIVMVLWFMLRTEKIISKNTDAIERLSDVVTAMCNSKRFK